MKFYKRLVASVLPVLCLTGASALASTITITPGGSVTIGDTQVSCAGAAAPAGIMFNCLCYNTGRTDNPPPQRIQVRSTDATQAMIDGRAICSTLNYGNPDFGFSPVSDCHAADNQ